MDLGQLSPAWINSQLRLSRLLDSASPQRIAGTVQLRRVLLRVRGLHWKFTRAGATPPPRWNARSARPIRYEGIGRYHDGSSGEVPLRCPPLAECVPQVALKSPRAR
jgi:hypothetical protein